MIEGCTTLLQTGEPVSGELICEEQTLEHEFEYIHF